MKSPISWHIRILSLTVENPHCYGLLLKFLGACVWFVLKHVWAWFMYVTILRVWFPGCLLLRGNFVLKSAIGSLDLVCCPESKASASRRLFKYYNYCNFHLLHGVCPLWGGYPLLWGFVIGSLTVSACFNSLASLANIPLMVNLKFPWPSLNKEYHTVCYVAQL